MKALALACLIAAACATRTQEPSAEARQWADMLYHSAGLSLWDCRFARPTVWFRFEYRNNPRIMAHELAHVAQMQRAGCEEWNRMILIPAVRDSLEQDARRQALGQ